MNKRNPTQAVALLANLGVIIGIAFLAFEISQNNKLLRAQAQFNFMLMRLNDRE